jgi:hypothetical protein
MSTLDKTQRDIKDVLDQDRARLEQDKDLLAHLALARQNALEVDNESSGLKYWLCLPESLHGFLSGAWGGAIAASFALVIFIFTVNDSPNQSALDPDFLDMDAELVLSLDEPVDDVEFYYWMEREKS